MKIGDIVKLNNDGRHIRDPVMGPWKGEILDMLPGGWIQVAWMAAAACDSCGQSQDRRIWTEREEFITPYVAFERFPSKNAA